MTTAGELSRNFGLLSSMYLCKPSKEAVANWGGLLRIATSPFLDELREAMKGIRGELQREMEDLLWDYTRLFIGPYKLPCPPWESVYRSPKRLLMREPYDKVSEFYRKLDLSIGDPNVLADHVGAELWFLAVLYGKTETEPETAPLYRDAARRFLAEHLRQWVPEFSADMERAADSGLYRALARATRDLVAAA